MPSRRTPDPRTGTQSTSCDNAAETPPVHTTLARDTAIISGATLLSRLLGFIRDCTIASVLGAGPLADAFIVALRLPNLMRRLFGEGSLSLTVISEFSHVRQHAGLPQAFAMIRACLIWLVLSLGVICLAAMYWSGPLTALLAPGFLDSPELFARTAELVRICFPYALLICITALCSAVLQAQGHFLAPALAPSVLNLCLIAGALLAWVAHWPIPETLAISLLVAGTFQIALQQPFLRRYGMSWRGPCSLSDAGARRVGILMLPSVFGAAMYQISIVLTTMLASLLPEGSIAHLYYADRLVQFPLGIFGIAVGTAALPALAKLAAGGKHEQFRDTLASALRLTLFISLPAAAGLAGMAVPIVEILFGRGAFSAADIAGTVHALWGYAPGLPAFAMTRPLLAAFHARHDPRTPLSASIAGLVVTILSGLGLMTLMGHSGLALAVSLGSWANVFILYFRLRRENRFLIGGLRVLTYFAMSTGVLFAALWVASQLSRGWALCAIPVIIVLYGLVATWLRSSEMLILLSLRKNHQTAL